MFLHFFTSIELHLLIFMEPSIGFFSITILFLKSFPPVGHCNYGADLAMQLAASLKSVLPTCGSIRISFSRRTPRAVRTLLWIYVIIHFMPTSYSSCYKQVSDIILAEFSNHNRVYIWNGQGNLLILLTSFWHVFLLNLNRTIEEMEAFGVFHKTD